MDISPSKKIRIKDIVERTCEKDDANTNYIRLEDGSRIFRVRILGTVINRFVSGDGKFAAITVDDGTGTIRCKTFNDIRTIEKFDKGHIVDIIGKIKNWNDETYIQPEAIVKTDDPNMETLRKLEIARDLEPSKRYTKEPEVVAEEAVTVKDTEIETESMPKNKSDDKPDRKKEPKEKTEEKINPKRKIIDIINDDDSGNGADYDNVIEKSGIAEKDAESIIEGLLEDGTCYEPRSGKIKVL